MSTNYQNILRAHMLAKKAVILWGSSGTGKTSILLEFAKTEKLKLILRSMSTIVPTELSMLIMEDGQVVEKFADWIQEILNKDGEPTLLFLDEITRPANDKAQAMLIPLISERMFNGRKIRDNVFIVGASNLSEEDHGVTELHDAVMRRCTHVAHRVSFDEEISVATGFTRQLKLQAGMSGAPQKQVEFEVPDLNCPRQRTDLALIIEAGKDFLIDEEIRIISNGRLGSKGGEGAIYAQAAIDILRNDNKEKLPDVFTKKDFNKVKKLQESGHIIELSHYFEGQVKGDKPNVDAILFLCTESVPELFQNVLSLTDGNWLMTKIGKLAAITIAGSNGKIRDLGIKK